MRKTCLIVLSLFLLWGCQANEEDIQFAIYEDIKRTLLEQEQFEESKDFSVRVIYNKTGSQYRYDVIIDQSQISMYNIVAMSYSDETDEQMCPSIGIFDNDAYHLKKDHVDKTNGFYKGIQLSGETTQNKNIKIYISYYKDKNDKKKVEKFIEVKNEIR